MLNNTITHKEHHYKTAVETTANAKQVFDALNEGLDAWWGDIISHSHFKTGGHFTVTFENDYWWTFKILDHTPNKELIWKCIDGEPDFNKEWIGHILHWRITQEERKTILNFHQIGLTPNIECYDVCSTTWDMFITKKLTTYLG